MRVLVLPYDPAWPRRFEAIRAQLEAALQGVPLVGIEHVGSTSVPGLAAKPILDIDVIVAAGQLGPAIAALAAAGYEHRGEMGVPDRHAFFAPDDGIQRNVYVTVDGCLSLRNHRGLRDLLRTDPALRDEYGVLKLRLSQREYGDIEEYVADKSELVQRILAKAGLGEDDLAAIAAINLPGAVDVPPAGV